MGAVHIQNPNSALLNFASREITQNDFLGDVLAQSLDNDSLISVLQKIAQNKKPFTEQDFAERLARKKIYHPKDFDQEIKDVNAGNFKYLIPSTLPKRRFKGFTLPFPQSQDIIESYNQAFKSRTYQDAMKNYELRQQQPDRYVPAGFESLQNLDVYAERGRALQRRGILGRRRIQSLGGEQVPQETL